MAGFDLRGGKPANYVLGRGKLYLSGDSTKTSSYGTGTDNTEKVWRDVGNCTAFTITQESETKEHKSSLQGLQVIDLEVAVSQKMTIGFSSDELNANNIARFLSGKYLGADNDDTDTKGLANGAAIASDDALISTSAKKNFYVETAATDRVHDVWYDLVLDLTDLTDGVANAPCVDFEATQLVDGACVTQNPSDNLGVGGTFLTEGTDYELDLKMGRIRFLSTGSMAAGDSFAVIWGTPSAGSGKGAAGGVAAGFDPELWVVQPLTTSGVTVGLKFVLENANDGDHPMGVEFWQVKLKPDGEMAGIGDDWATLNFTGVVESVAASGYPYGSDYGRILGRDSFQ